MFENTVAPIRTAKQLSLSTVRRGCRRHGLVMRRDFADPDWFHLYQKRRSNPRVHQSFTLDPAQGNPWKREETTTERRVTVAMTLTEIAALVATLDEAITSASMARITRNRQYGRQLVLPFGAA